MREELIVDNFSLTEEFYLTDIEEINYEKTDNTYNIEVEDVHLYFANNFYVKNSGRMPAVLLSEKISHPDIEEFITSKKERGKIENANISVQITDDFIDALENNKTWTLSFDTQRESIRKEIDPNYLIDLIAETAAQSAEPGVQYINLMKKGTISEAIYKSTNDKKYEIISTNACAEKPLSPYNGCNLLSINMEMFSTNSEEFKEQLKKFVPSLVRLSDNVITYELSNNLSPVEEQKEILSKMREIGLGLTNLHGWLLKDNIQYDSDEAIEKVEEFIKYYAYYVFLASIELGKEKGNAPAFEEIKDVKDLMYSTYFSNIVNEFFDGDPYKVKYMRNMANMSLAPTGSLSSIFPSPCISSGIEPVIGPYYWRRTRAVNKGTWDYYFVIPDKVKEYVLNFINNEEDYNKLNEFYGSILDNDGKIGKELIEIMNKYVSENFFKPAHQIDPMKKIELLSKLYNWVDAGISCTFNLPVNTTQEDVKNIYLEAYRKGVRAVSVYREGSREGILIFEDPITHKRKYSDDNPSLCLQRPEDIVYHCAPKRPDELHCEIHHTTVKGEKWLVLIGMFDGKPYELFAGEKEDLAIPQTVKEGTIVKNGKSTYNLQIRTRKTEVEFKDIADQLMSAEQRALTRMISTCLRHGVPVEFITKQLKKSKNDITDFASAVSRILSRYETGLLEEQNNCPNCGDPMVKAEGCMKCMNCLYSRCS